MIPEAAVEAAAQALRASRLNGRQGIEWRDLDSKYLDEYRKSAKAVLEAAAPHMLAEAWEAGMAAAKLQAAGIKPARNPYRTAK